MGNSCHSLKKTDHDKIDKSLSEHFPIKHRRDKKYPTAIEKKKSLGILKEIHGIRKSELNTDMTIKRANSRSKTRNSLNTLIRSTSFQNAHLSENFFLNFPEKDPKKFYNIVKTISNSSSCKISIVNCKESMKKKILKEVIINSSEYEVILETNCLETLCKIDHLNIIKYFDYFAHERKIYYTVEYSEKGTLTDKINQGILLKESQVSLISFQILKALDYLHKKGLAHRNIKPDSILFVETSFNENLSIVKLSDFRRCKKLEKGVPENELIGSSFFIPPEVLMGEYDEKCDLWSLGVTLYFGMFGKAPFIGDTEELTFDLILNEEVKFDEHPFFSRDCLLFIKKLLIKDPTKRPSAHDALSDNWIQKFNYEFFKINDEETFKTIRRMRKTRSFLIKKNVKLFLIDNMKINSDLIKIYNVFDNFDADADGKITKNELIQLYSKLLKSVKNIEYNENDPNIFLDIEKIFKEYDDNNNGTLSLEEFIIATLENEIIKKEENLDLLYNFLLFHSGNSVDFTSLNLIFKKECLKEKSDFLLKFLDELALSNHSYMSVINFKRLMKDLL